MSHDVVPPGDVRSTRRQMLMAAGSGLAASYLVGRPGRAAAAATPEALDPLPGVGQTLSGAPKWPVAPRMEGDVALFTPRMVQDAKHPFLYRLPEPPAFRPGGAMPPPEGYDSIVGTADGQGRVAVRDSSLGRRVGVVRLNILRRDAAVTPLAGMTVQAYGTFRGTDVFDVECMLAEAEDRDHLDEEASR